MKKILLFIFIIISLITLSSCIKEDSNPILEPPLNDKEINMPVPEFLNEEQQLLYRRAYSVYYAISWNSILIDYPDFVKDYKFEPIRPKFDGYLISPYGRYTKYTDFEKLIKSVFTDEFWNQVNNRKDNKGEIYQRFKNCDGSLCYIEYERGGSLSRNRNFEDTFELISSSDEKIEFYVIGYYSYRYFINDNETEEQRYNRLKSNYEYIEKHPVRFVLTENGWRVDYFEMTDSDEGNYAGKYS